MTDILAQIKAYLDDFNRSEEMDFSIDSIRIDFSKEHKLEALQEVGHWKKIDKHSNILKKLKKRLHDEELTSAHRLKGYDVYYYNLQDPPKYRRARMVIFGLKQYHKVSTHKSIVRRVLEILKDVSNIDICFDTDRPPNLEKLAQYFTLSHYQTTTYVNSPFIPMVERIVFYDKQLKNTLSVPLWRMEATVTVPNWKVLALPLHDLKEITALAWSKQ